MIDIGMLLKSDEMIDFLETYDLSVTYHFDRIHEGQADSYSVKCDAPPLELLFDEEQHCRCIFVKAPADPTAARLVRYPYLQTPKEIESYANSEGLTLRQGPSWLRCDGRTHCFHYELDEGSLKMITIMAPATAP